jgi:hypothetical protein
MDGPALDEVREIVAIHREALLTQHHDRNSD